MTETETAAKSKAVTGRGRSPWWWVPSLFFTEGMPYVLANTVSVVLFKRLGFSNADIALYTSWLYLPWIIKPLWSPLIEIFRTKRFWIVLTQIAMGAALACVGLALPCSDPFRYGLAFFWLLAFSSATHDIAADGFYMLGMAQYQQSAFIGVRTIFYRLASITAQGALVVLAGMLEKHFGNIATGWSVTFLMIAAVILAMGIYHALVLPRPIADAPTSRKEAGQGIAGFLEPFRTFFLKKDILAILAFLFFYRFAEAQLLKMVAPFLLDLRSAGGLGLATEQVGVIYGTVGVALSMTGGLLGGYVISRRGLKFWLWIMVGIMHVPDLLFVYLSWSLPENLYGIALCVALEQFGYGFGFTAYSLFVIMISDGPYKTAHYAIATGIMALGMMIPGMLSGRLQEMLGYQNFFLWIIVSTIPGLIVPALVRIDKDFGRRTDHG